MNLNTKTKTLCLLLSGAVIFGSIYAPIQPLSIYATAVEDETVKEVETSENTENVVGEDSQEPAKIFNWDDYYDSATGQINASQFTAEAAGMYPLTISATVKEGFDIDCYIYLVETEHQDRKIRVDLYPEDDFTRTVYLPYGYYEVVESGAKLAPTLSFNMNSFSVNLNDQTTNSELNMVLNNAGKVVINDLGVWEDKTVSDAGGITNSKLYGVEALEGIQSDISGILYYSVTHTGPKKTRMVDKEVEVMKDGQYVTEIQQVEEVYYGDAGLGYVTPFGSANKSADVVLMISKEGVVGQAEFKVSYDGGQTFTARYATGEAVEDSNIGLTYNFYTLNDTDEFTEGDRFNFRSIESFTVKNSESSPDTRITCVGHPTEDHELEISILSSGGRGVSRAKIVDNKGNMEAKTYLIPNDGVMILDDNLTLYFENVKGYVKGVEYTIAITSHDTTINYTPVIILGISAALAFLVGFFWLLMKKDKVGDYIVHVYEWKQDESMYNN